MEQEQQKPYVIGLDLGGTNSVFGIVDRRGSIIATTSVKTQEQNDVEVYVDNCCTALKKIIEEVGGIEKIQAMGIGAPDANYYTGIIDNPANLPWKGEIPLAKMFSDRLGIPVALTNDANAAAIGEMAYGAAKGMKNFIMITLGTGVGSGIVVNGQVVYGSDGFAGELGHVIVDKSSEARSCGCGRKGCLETYCSATGVARTAQMIVSSSERPTLLRNIPLDEITSKDVAIAASQGDEVAKEIFEFTGKILGEACADFAAFSSPEAFIFFGGLTKAGDLLMDPIKKAYDENVLFLYKNKAQMIVSELDDAGAAVLGASALGWEL
ncbi:MAG: ROK family protein [Candidatus Paraprevotella stercoravium]|uniref:ROK family protein n=2 Tax=Bacteroidales TaxID=171549 RepID=A0ABT7U4T2_9BACE|nr:ROK family protein [Candidatus Paraprevotella stercoravium]MDM8145524.1 ROK family protein [Bacteroides eggerthii]